MNKLIGVRAVDVAYDLLKEIKEGMPFKELWSQVKTKLNYSEAMASKKVSQFYTDLSLDGRFVALENNVWNLKIHCKYDEVAVREEELVDADDDDESDEDSENNEESYDEESSETLDY